MEQHTHGPDGFMIVTEEPAAIETVVEAEATETVAEASVEIARIEADRDVELAKESTKQTGVYASEELATLQGEVRALRELVDALKPPEPEPAPAPIVVEPPVPVEEITEPVPPVVENKPAVKKPGGLSWW